MPNSPKPHIIRAISAAGEHPLAEQRHGDHRLGRARSTSTNAQAERAARANAPRISGDVQPRSWPSISA